MLKKMWNQNGRPRPPAVAIDEIKIFDNDDQAAKHLICVGYGFLATTKLLRNVINY